jgi:hypothetical protein
MRPTVIFDEEDQSEVTCMVGADLNVNEETQIHNASSNIHKEI